VLDGVTHNIRIPVRATLFNGAFLDVARVGLRRRVSEYVTSSRSLGNRVKESVCGRVQGLWSTVAHVGKFRVLADVIASTAPILKYIACLLIYLRRERGAISEFVSKCSASSIAVFLIVHEG